MSGNAGRLQPRSGKQFGANAANEPGVAVRDDHTDHPACRLHFAYWAAY